MKENQWVVCLALNLAVSMGEKTVVQSVGERELQSAEQMDVEMVGCWAALLVEL